MCPMSVNEQPPRRRRPVNLLFIDTSHVRFSRRSGIGSLATKFGQIVVRGVFHGRLPAANLRHAKVGATGRAGAHPRQTRTKPIV